MMVSATSRLSTRTVILLAAAGLTILAASGWVEAEAFSVPTTLKYALTVLAPLVVFSAALTDKPMHLITGLVVVAAPFVGATAELAGTRVSVLVPLLAVGFLLTVVTESAPGRPPALRWAAVVTFPLLLIPLSDGSNNHQFVISLFLLLSVGWLVFHTARDEQGMKVVFVAVAVQAAIQGVIAIWSAKTGRTVNLYSTPGTTGHAANYIYIYGSLKRPSAMFPDPISLSNALAIAIPLMVALLLVVRSWTSRLLVLGGLAIVIAALILALDRTSWIADVFALLLVLLFLPRKLRRRTAPFVLIGVALVVAVALAFGGSGLTARVSSIFAPTVTQGKTQAQRGQAEGEQERLQYWSAAFKEGFVDHPLAGVGIGNIGSLLLRYTPSAGAGTRAGTGQFANAASTYLQLIGEGGLFAVALFFILFAGLFQDVRAGLRAHPILGAGLAGAVVALLICWVTDIVVYYESVAACVGVLLGAVAASGYGSRAPREDVPRWLKWTENAANGYL
ncbi:MAG: O-antigen ligase family protein [Solirubrobacteraceae bacterium]